MDRFLSVRARNGVAGDPAALPGILCYSRCGAFRTHGFFDSESLLRELDRCRELVLEIPITNPNTTHFGINVAVTAIWNLRENLRYLLALHRDGQRAFAKQSDEAEHKQQKKTAAHATSKIVGIRA